MYRFRNHRKAQPNKETDARILRALEKGQFTSNGTVLLKRKAGTPPRLHFMTTAQLERVGLTPATSDELPPALKRLVEDLNAEIE
jgi:hypothetical protein